ncbi:MAG TPA: helix-turn-helix transcriptional regulator [Gemmatimonadaceae bacterium]|nr:helix-turn-helix transcriptional regulator [Gemmatimonadaceae bacterium]
MKKADLPGAFEQLVMLAVARLGDAAYGMTVRRELEERTNRNVSLGAVYATLDRLEAKAYVSSDEGATTEARGGRAKRFFRLTARGVGALNEGIQAMDRMREGVAGIPRPASAT